MAAEINIYGNGLRLLCRVFMVIVPLKKMKVNVGGIYNCIVNGIGEMGQIECIRISTAEMGSITESINEMSDCSTDHIEEFRRQGYYKIDKMQICFFRFKRRNDERFSKLIEIDTKRIGLNLAPQKTLF